MAIERIKEFRKCKVFRDFSWPVGLRPFSKFNLIYGLNGTGKTTISRVLRNLELRCPPPEGSVTLVLDGEETTGADFPGSTLPIRVFNRDFITDSVFSVEGGDVPLILVLGTENVAKQKKVETLKQTSTTLQRNLETISSKRQRADREKDRYCIQRGSVIRTLLRGFENNPYNNYNKRHYNNMAADMLAEDDLSAYFLTENQRDELIAQHRSPPKERIPELSSPSLELDELRARTERLLAITVVSETVPALRDNVQLAEWVRDGLSLHRGHNADTCLFCTQPLPSDRLAILEGHFNAAYQRLIGELEALHADIQLVINSDPMSVIPNGAQFYDHISAEFAEAESGLSTRWEHVIRTLKKLDAALTGKQSELFKGVELPEDLPVLSDSPLYDQVNLIISKHNQMCATHNERAQEARRTLEQAEVANSLVDYKSLTDDIAKYEAKQLCVEAELRRVNGEIATLEMEITEYRRPAEELNLELQTYLGHDELQLVAKQTGYSLSRDGVPATEVSDGETTAIALLYFLKTLLDLRFNLSEGVVVLDDPISSLDANSLYLAFGLIQQRTRDAGQLFVLTHNFTFFRQVRNWFHHLKGQRRTREDLRPAAFYMLNCPNETGQKRNATISTLDPLLEEYESEYHFLFSCIYRAAHDSSGNAADLYTLPNVARRVLEAFLAFRRPDVSGDLWSKMKSVKFDDARKIQILRFVHSHSHSDAIIPSEHDPSLLAEAQNVLKAALDLMSKADPDHYNGLVSLLKTQ